jgi:hypothetical protein
MNPAPKKCYLVNDTRIPFQRRYMRQVIVICALISLLSLNAFSAATPNRQSDEIMTSKGILRLRPLYHGSVMLEFEGKIIHIDPWSQADYTGLPQADLILSTHTHADHMDAMLINKLKKPTTTIVAPAAVADTLNGAVGIVKTISNGEKKTFLGI